MKKKINIFLFIIFLFTSAILTAQENLAQVLTEKQIFYSEVKDAYLKIDIKLEKNGYIYANPKGPGTGKPIEVEAIINSSKVNDIYISPSEKYYPESSPEWINRYSDSFSIVIPLEKTDFVINSEINLKINYLFCNDQTCTPGDLDETFLLTRSGTQSANLLEKLPDGYTIPGTKQNNDNSISTNDIKSKEVTGIFIALLFGFIAGIILNFMPCVLPVVSLKIMSFVKNADNDKKTLRLTGLFFSAGIIISFLMLATIISILGYNWGQIFQNTSFVIIMIILMFSFSLSFFDVYTLNIPEFAVKGSGIKVKNIYIEALFHGFFATLLATPCSGPFLGATLTWTLSQPIYIIYAIFLSIGLGMSIPYVLLTFSPGLRKIVPKPGNWMITFERIMGFLLFGTIIFFISFLEKTSVIPVLIGLLVAALSLWIFGKYGSLEKSKKTRIIAKIIFIILMISAIFLALQKEDKENINLNAYTSETLQNLNDGEVYLIKFTADWCINCRVLEKTVYDTDKLEKLKNQYNLKLIKADLTSSNPVAEEYLNRLGSKSIPFAAIFSKETVSNPIILRDIYTLRDIENALKLIPETKLESEENDKNDFEIEEIDFSD